MIVVMRGIVIICLALGFLFSWIPLPREPEKELTSRLEIWLEREKHDFVPSLEFYLSSSVVPYASDSFVKLLKKDFQFSFVRLYDEEFRLLSSFPDSKEYYLKELRHSGIILKPGETKEVSDSEICYRFRDGKFYLVFGFGVQRQKALKSPFHSFPFLYWVFQSNSGFLRYTNDPLVLSGEVEPNDLVTKLDTTVKKFTHGAFTVYLLQEPWGFNWNPTPLFVAFGISLLLLGFGYRDSNVKHRYFLILTLVCLFFTTFIQNFFPDARYSENWSSLRKKQIESIFESLFLELAQGDTRNPIWKHTQRMSEKDLPYYLLQASQERIPRILPWKGDLLFFVPIDGSRDYQMGFVGSESLVAKKEQTEIYNPILSEALDWDWQKSSLPGYTQLGPKMEMEENGFLLDRENWTIRGTSPIKDLLGLKIQRARSNDPLYVGFFLFPVLVWMGILDWMRKKSKEEFLEVYRPPHQTEILAEAVVEEAPILLREEPQFPTSKMPSQRKFFPPSSWREPRIPKREAIFTSELRTLVEEVSGFTPQPLPSYPALSKSPEAPTSKDVLHRALKVREDSPEVRQFFSSLGTRWALLQLQPELGIYNHVLSNGLDAQGRAQLLFVYNDPFLDFKEEQTFFKILTEDMRKNVFLSKKLSWELMYGTRSIWGISIHEYGYDGILLYFLDHQSSPEFSEEIQFQIRTLIPSLHLLTNSDESESKMSSDGLTWIKRAFAYSTLGGERSVHVYKVHFENYKPSPTVTAKKLEIKNKIKEHFESFDLFLETSANSILILCKKDLKKEVYTFFKEIPFPSEIKVLFFPEDGENPFLYL